MTNQISKQRIVMIALGLILILSNIEAHKNSKGIPLADPFILCSNGMYYAYGTSSQEGFKVYVSKDLEKWTLGDTPLGNHLVLQKVLMYGDSRIFGLQKCIILIISTICFIRQILESV